MNTGVRYFLTARREARSGPRNVIVVGASDFTQKVARGFRGHCSDKRLSIKMSIIFECVFCLCEICRFSFKSIKHQ